MSDIISILKILKGIAALIVSMVKRWLNKKFIDKSNQINEDFKRRNHIEPLLNNYVILKAKQEIKDIGVCLVHWKNYPNQPREGYKDSLRIEYHNNQALISSYINNTGIFLQDHLWYSGSSIYVDKNGKFFIAQQEQNHLDFVEHKDKCLVKHLPFSNIINVDFKETVGYEPVFHVKYDPIAEYKKLYSSFLIIREKPGNQYLKIELNTANEIKKFSLFHRFR